MIRYADPTRCPDCGTNLAPRSAACGRCGLPLSGELPSRLFATLAEADRLLGQLRQAPVPVPAPMPASAPMPAPAPYPPFQYPPAPPRPNTGLSSATVPRILLGLGALCLVIAALIFLAVTWAALGISGRTAILLALTVAALAAAQVFARRSLPAATESFTVIGLAFAGFTVAGAASAGWLPSMPSGVLTAAVGAVLTVLGLATAEASRRVPGKLLHSGEVGACVGVLLLVGGAADALPVHTQLVLTVSVLVLGGAALASRRPLDTLRRISALALAGLFWLTLAVTGLARAVQHTRFDELWADLEVWPLLVAALLAAAPLAFRSIPGPWRLVAASTAATLGWIAIWLPIAAIDSGTAAVAVSMIPLVLASAAIYLARPPWQVVPGAPLVLSAAVPVCAAMYLAGAAVVRMLSVGVWTATFGERLPSADAAISGLLLVPLTLAVLLGGAAFTRLFTDPRPALIRAAAPLGAALALAATATMAHDAVPISLVIGLTLTIGLVLAAWSLLSCREPWLGLAGAVLALALLLSVTGDWFTAVSLAAIAALAAALTLRADGSALRVVGDATAPPTLAAAAWVFADIAGAPVAIRALAILVVLGALTIARPRLAGEIATAATAVITIIAGTAAAESSQSAASWLAINLTVAGALIGVHSILTPSRRRLSWLAAAILVLASWVRLAQLGVSAPEAYTLPAAVALLAVGLFALRRDPAARTHVLLAPGLALGLVPSLLWALGDPVTLRGLLLALACTALVVAGATLSWSAPLLYGAVVGALLALSELAPLAMRTNPWILTAILGVVLTGFGITWERRLRELRLAGAYLTRLR